jgi:RNA polymerase sigma-70 factor (ECF subfamily)
MRVKLNLRRLSDEKLIARSLHGELEAFEALVKRYKDEVYTSAYFMMGNPVDAHDASQEVFIKLYGSLGKFGGRSSFSTWLYRMTVNTCIDAIRSRKRYQTRNVEINSENENVINMSSYANISSPEEELLRVENKDRIISEIVVLEDKYRIPLVLRDICGYSYKDISDFVGLPLGTIKSNIFRARRILRDSLHKERNVLLREAKIKDDER